jgi:hypothetical protein
MTFRKHRRPAPQSPSPSSSQGNTSTTRLSIIGPTGFNQNDSDKFDPSTYGAYIGGGFCDDGAEWTRHSENFGKVLPVPKRHRVECTCYSSENRERGRSDVAGESEGETVTLGSRSGGGLPETENGLDDCELHRQSSDDTSRCEEREMSNWSRASACLWKLGDKVEHLNLGTRTARSESHKGTSDERISGEHSRMETGEHESDRAGSSLLPRWTGHESSWKVIK